MTIVKLLKMEDVIKLFCVHTKFYRVAHDREIWKVFHLNKDPYRNPELCAVLKKHSLHFEKINYQKRRDTLFNYVELSCIQSELKLCINFTEIDLTDNLLIIIEFCKKNMPKLKTINISGCNLLGCHELQYLYGHQNLKTVLLREFYGLRQSRCLYFLTELPHKLNLESLDIDRSTYLNLQVYKSIITGSHLKTVHFSPKWKKPPVWKHFWEDFVNIKFGLDFMAVLDFNLRGFRSSRLQELYNVAPFLATFDSEKSNSLCL